MAPTVVSVASTDCISGASCATTTCSAMESSGDSTSGERRVSSSSSNDSSGTSGSGSSTDRKNNTNIYVSELPPAMTEDKFQEMFAPFGIVISARLAPRRKGFLLVGFVQYTTAEAADAAIAAMDRHKVLGSRISVRLARRDKDKGISSKPSNTLYVAKMPAHFSEVDLRDLFSIYGAVRSIVIFRHPESGISKGTAMVRFMDLHSAMAAKEALHCFQISESEGPMEVKFAESKQDKELRLEGHPAPIPEQVTVGVKEPVSHWDMPTLQLVGEPTKMGMESVLHAGIATDDDFAMRVLRNCLQFLASCTPPAHH